MALAVHWTLDVDMVVRAAGGGCGMFSVDAIAHARGRSASLHMGRVEGCQESRADDADAC